MARSVIAALCFLAASPVILPAQAASATPKIQLTLTVMDLTANKPIKQSETVPAGHQFNVTVSTNDIDCAGQFAVTALGAPGAPPEAGVQALAYVIGPSSGSNSATGQTLTVTHPPSGKNDFKISATCNGAVKRQFGVKTFEFYSTR